MYFRYNNINDNMLIQLSYHQYNILLLHYNNDTMLHQLSYYQYCTHTVQCTARAL